MRADVSASRCERAGICGMRLAGRGGAHPEALLLTSRPGGPSARRRRAAAATAASRFASKCARFAACTAVARGAPPPPPPSAVAPDAARSPPLHAAPPLNSTFSRAAYAASKSLHSRSSAARPSRSSATVAGSTCCAAALAEPISSFRERPPVSELTCCSSCESGAPARSASRSTACSALRRSRELEVSTWPSAKSLRRSMAPQLPSSVGSAGSPCASAASNSCNARVFSRSPWQRTGTALRCTLQR